MQRSAVCLALIAVVSAALAQAPDAPPASAAPAQANVNLVSSQANAGAVDISLQMEAKAAVARGLKWLAAKQKENGSWSNESFPALTALPLWAFSLAKADEYDALRKKAVEFILTCRQPDGGLYRDVKGEKGGGLSNYNTAICMTALHAHGDPALVPDVLRARKFVAASQHLGDDTYRGGMGYDKGTGRPYTDLNNTVIAFEGMRLTEGVEDLRPAGEEKTDLNWAAATQYLAKVQNTSDAGPEDAGGFAYRPDESKAGSTSNAAGRIVFRSYGSMTYAGMLSLIYAQVSRDDPRVRSAFDWSVRHWNLEENPGMQEEGLYYFYHILTKAMNAYGRDRITLADGASLNWRSELIRKLVKLQKTDPDTGNGYWINEANRWWESDPVLVTSYTLIALQIAMGL